MFNKDTFAGAYRIKVVIFFILVAVGFWFNKCETNSRYRVLQFSKLPKTDIKSVFVNRGDYHGKLVRVHGMLRGNLLSPISKTPCFYYSVDVDAYYEGRENGEDWNEIHDIFKEERGIAFIIEGEHRNQIQVFPQKMNWEPKSSTVHIGIKKLFPILEKIFSFQQIKDLALQTYIDKDFKAFRTTEEVGPVNRQAWIIGILDTSENKVALRAINGKAPYILSYLSYSIYLKSIKKKAKIYLFFKWFFWILGGTLSLYYWGRAFYEDWTG